MSIDRSLKAANALIRHRNVLNRAERLEILKDEERWNEDQPVFGLPKVAHRKQAVGGKAAKEEAAEGAAAEGAATPAAAATAAPAGKAAAGGAAPAKAGAPAAKAPAAKGKK